MLAKGRALVTGGAKRIGRSLVEALSEDGWTVGIHYKSSKKEAENCVNAIVNAGGNAATLYCNLSNPTEVNQLIKCASVALDGPVNLLINSASHFEDDTAQTFNQDSWDAHFEPNLRSPVTLARDMARHLPEKESGLVINIIDQRVKALKPNLFSYTLSKSALWTATQTLAQSLAPNVRVVAISPGPTLANIYMSEEEFQAKKQRTLTKRGSSLNEIVKATRYIISADSLTGSMIMADGGQHLARK